jgi:hypothetical protein
MPSIDSFLGLGVVGVVIVAAFYSQNIPRGLIWVHACQALTRFQSPNKLSRTRLDIFCLRLMVSLFVYYTDSIYIKSSRGGRVKKWPFLRGKIQQECVALVLRWNNGQSYSTKVYCSECNSVE